MDLPSDFLYGDDSFSSSIHDIAKENSLMSLLAPNDNIVKSVEEMLNSSDDGLTTGRVNMYKHSSDEDIQSPMSSSDRLSSSIKDDYDSLPQTPIDDILSSSYTNPLGQIENIAYSSSYSDDLMRSDDSEGSESMKPTCYKPNNYDTSALMYGNDDMTTFSGVVNCNEVLRTNKRQRIECQGNTIVCCYKSVLSEIQEPFVAHPIIEIKKEDEKYLSAHDSPLEDSKKGKISGLQRNALDMIFSVTDRPSRGLVLHIAAELQLHHITVKNFFSNGRRRLRRAAARLNDPERTRRENQRRKEKRRLAALAAAAALPNGEKVNGSLKAPDGSDVRSAKETPTLSPERRALMEKLAVKVQRSVAQKVLANSEIKTPDASSGSISTNVVIPSSISSGKCFQYQYSSPETSPVESSPPILSSNLHSNFISNPVINTFQIQHQLVEQPYNEIDNAKELASILAYPQHDNLIENQNSSFSPTPEERNSDKFSMSVDQEDGWPYSPTSWQTLLNV